MSSRVSHRTKIAGAIATTAIEATGMVRAVVTAIDKMGNLFRTN